MSPSFRLCRARRPQRLGRLGRRVLKMQRVAQVLQFAIVVKRRRPSSGERQFLEEFDFLRGCIAAQSRILQEGLKPGFFAALRGRFSFHERRQGVIGVRVVLGGDNGCW